MDISRCNTSKQTRLGNKNCWRRFFIHRNSDTTIAAKYNHNKQNYHHRLYSGIGICLYSITFSHPVFANSTTIASPSATSQGSVINQGIQVQSGSFIFQEVGDGIRCSGTTLTINPFISKVDTWKDPYEPTYQENVYDDSTDDNGNLLNPGGVLYTKPIRTGQARNNLSFNYGITATIAVPLDRRMTNNCVAAMNSRIKYLDQAYKTKKLDYSLSRLKVCAEQLKLGVMYAKDSPSYVVCEDVRLVNPPNTLPDHKHSISENLSVPFSFQKGSLQEASSSE
tara:strand:+ start:252 stop:1094 length:843 start_codon:yes stop_codon:yes gene_type:complete